MKNWIRGSFILTWMLLLFSLCDPVSNPYKSTTPAGYTVIRPPWIPKSQVQNLNLVVDKYLGIYSLLTQDNVPSDGLIIKIESGPQIIIGDAVYDGYYKANKGIRTIQLVWRRTSGGQLAVENPLPTFLHELIHDRQFRHRSPINHEFTDAEKVWSGSDLYTKIIHFGDEN